MLEKQITIKGLEVHYEVFGNGKPMLILHGWGSNSDRWQATAELLAQKGLCVVVPDLPGFGKSQEPPQAWYPDAYVDWLHEFADKVPELQKSFMLLGHSFGGAVAAKFSIKYNQRIAQLFLVSAACIRERTASKKAWSLVARSMKLFSFLPGYALARKAFYKFIIRRSDYPYVSGVMQETYLRIIGEDLRHRMIFVKVPTVLIWGEKDDITPLSQAEFIHQKIRNSVMETIPGADHAVQIKFPDQLAEKITAHVAPA